MAVQVETEALLTSRQVAQWLGISASTLCRMRQEARVPGHGKVPTGGRVRSPLMAK